MKIHPKSNPMENYNIHA